MQLNLGFLEIAEATADVWKNLDHEQQQTVVGKLARLITQTALATHKHDRTNNEDDNDD